jgi:hypothetical protein
VGNCTRCARAGALAKHSATSALAR